MSASQFDEFDRRMRRISRRNTKLSQGYVTQVTKDGMVIAKPRRKGNGSTLRGLIILAFVMMLFKGFLHAQLGDVAYQARIDGLAEGSVFEQAGAWVMTADPVTQFLSTKISSLVR
ncbi:MAG: hypothetical protein AAFY06_08835 [Pseudomonadota bacterium]